MHEALMKTWPLALALAAATLGGCEGASGIAAAILLGVATLITACGRSPQSAVPPSTGSEDQPTLTVAKPEAATVIAPAPSAAPPPPGSEAPPAPAAPRARVRRVDAPDAPVNHPMLRGGPRWTPAKDEPR